LEGQIVREWVKTGGPMNEGCYATRIFIPSQRNLVIAFTQEPAHPFDSRPLNAWYAQDPNKLIYHQTEEVPDFLVEIAHVFAEASQRLAGKVTQFQEGFELRFVRP
jgi:hypothetical protein